MKTLFHTMWITVVVLSVVVALLAMSALKTSELKIGLLEDEVVSLEEQLAQKISEVLEKDRAIAALSDSNIKLQTALAETEGDPWYSRVFSSAKASTLKAKDAVKGWFTDVSWENDLTRAVNEKVEKYNDAIFEWAKDRPMDESISNAEKLVSMPEVREMFEQGKSVSMKMIEHAGLSEEDTTIVKEYLEEVMTFEKIAPLVVEIYEDIFTEEELQLIIEMYTSDIGAAVMEKMPFILEKAMNLGESLVDEKEILRRLEAVRT